jgi:peptidyl-prolyl cis-trans isomerase C
MPGQLPEVLARVNGEPVRRSDFDRLIKNIEAGSGPIPVQKRDEVLRHALDQLITYTVMTQEARTRNLSVSDAEIEQRLTQMRSQFPKEEDFRKALAARNTSVEQLRTDARVDLTIGKMMEAEIAGASTVTEPEARAFYAKNPDRFKQEETVRASHILLKVDENAPEAARKAARARMDGILKRARSGADFAALAREHSQDGSAREGGDLGYFERARMVPPFSQAAFALKPGEISDVVTTQFGYHIIKVTDRKPAAMPPFDQVGGRIVDFLVRQKKQERAQQFIDDVKKRARIEVLV